MGGKIGGNACGGDGNATEVRLRGGMDVVSVRLAFGLIVPSPISTPA